MNRKEAIWILENRDIDGNLTGMAGGYKELLDFCLEALKQQKSQEDEIYDNLEGYAEKVDIGGTHPIWVCKPAQPECKQECMPMYADVSDCISRQAAIDALGERPMVWMDSDYEIAQRNQYDMDKLAIETVPPAQPEIVRCRGCKHYISVRNPWRETKACNRWADLLNTREDDYCSFAERKEDE